MSIVQQLQEIEDAVGTMAVNADTYKDNEKQLIHDLITIQRELWSVISNLIGED